MALDTKDLERLIRLCPKINLSNKDLKEIIESESYNNCIAKYTKKNPRNAVEEETLQFSYRGLAIVPADDPTVTGTIETVTDEEISDAIDEVDEQETHIEECEDESCACKEE